MASPAWRRRDVLVLLAGALTACGGGGRRGETTTDGGGRRVVVLGAGVAGLAAAADLNAAGFDVLVLEARDRLGGRVFSDPTWSDAPVDVGASWIHGIEDNELYDRVKAWGLETATTDYDARVRFDAEGERLSDAASDTLDALLEELTTAIAEEQERRDAADAADGSLADFVAQYLTERGADAATRRKLLYLLNTEIEHEYAADADDLSLRHFDEAADEGGVDVLFPGGYSQVVARLAEGLTVQLSTVVTGVEVGASGVVVTAGTETYEAAFCVCTLPLGVLRAGRVTFDPPLSSAKQTALKRVNAGVLDKLYLRFTEAFWTEEDQAGDAQLIGYVGEEKGRFAEFLNLAHYTGKPILLCFNAGAYGVSLEALDDTAVVAQAMQTLRTLFGEDIPEPVGFVRTRWGRDPFALGSYSHLAPGGTAADLRALAAPEGRLFFAGEHTDTGDQATVRGAYRSGLRAAAEVLARVEGVA